MLIGTRKVIFGKDPDYTYILTCAHIGREEIINKNGWHFLGHT